MDEKDSMTPDTIPQSTPVDGTVPAGRKHRRPVVIGVAAVAAVALFVAGMSLTLMLKGHHIDSEISTNKEMQRRGIKCAVQETREAMQQADCSDTSGLCSGNCAGCDVEHEQK